jgi:hypothetical protein
VHGLVTGVVTVVVVVVVDVVVLDVVDVVDVVVVDDGTGGFVVVVVVVVELVPPVTGRLVDVVLVLLDVVVLLDAVVVDELTGGAGSLDGTQRPNSGEKKSKKRRGAFAERAPKHTRSPAVAVVGCGPDGTHTSHGSSTRTMRLPFTVTGTGGAKRTELDDG